MQGLFRLGALQSVAGKELLQRVGRSPEDLSSIVLVTEDDFYVKSDAILRIGKQLNVPFWLLSTMLLPLPNFVRDTLYDQVRVRSAQKSTLHEHCHLQRRSASSWLSNVVAVPHS